MHILGWNKTGIRRPLVMQVRLSPAEQVRADVYALLAALLLAPEPRMVASLADSDAIDADDPLGRAWNALRSAARRCAMTACGEHEALFVAAGAPRLNPYQGHYRDRWPLDKPLACLRDDLRALGLQRAVGATELEDHLGALCEAMRALIETGRSADVQRDFFSRHLAGWSGRCLRDIASSPYADFYRTFAAFAHAFLEQECGEEESLVA